MDTVHSPIHPSYRLRHKPPLLCRHRSRPSRVFSSNMAPDELQHALSLQPYHPSFPLCTVGIAIWVVDALNGLNRIRGLRSKRVLHGLERVHCPPTRQLYTLFSVD